MNKLVVKMNKKFIVSMVAVLASSSAYAQSTDKKLADLENRLSELEAQSSINIFKFSGVLTERYDSFSMKQDRNSISSSTQKFDERVDYLRTTFSLNASADVSKYIKFYSTITMSKYNNVYGTQAVGSGTAANVLTDFSIAKSEAGAQPFVEKAYADVLIGDTGLTYSFGRLPTSDGPPFHLQNGRPRMGTYPGLLFNAEMDGMALTYSKKMDDQAMAFRVVHAPFTRRTDATGKLTGSGVVTNPTLGGNRANTLIDFDTAMAEYSKRNTSFADNISVILQAWQLSKMPIDYTDIGGMTSGYAETSIGAQAIHVDMENVAKSNFDFSLTVMQSKVENDGCVKASGVCQIFGFGATKQGEGAVGSSTLVGARYKLTNSSFLGGEYLQGGKSTFVYDANNDTLAAFYATTGVGTHFYGLHKFTPELSLRAGYMNQKYDSEPFKIGSQGEIDRIIQTYYANLRLDF